MQKCERLMTVEKISTGTACTKQWTRSNMY